MAEHEIKTEETVETTDVQEPKAEAPEVSAPEEVKDGLFTRIGKSVDGKIQKAKAFGKRNGKKIAKGAGVAAGAAVAVVGTAIVVDTMERAKALTDGSEPAGDAITVEPVSVEDVYEAPFEAEAAEPAA